jgi:hypothetical protein
MYTSFQSVHVEGACRISRREKMREKKGEKEGKKGTEMIEKKENNICNDGSK